jgi:hypothetical protein
VTLSERVATGLRTAGLTPRQFAPIVGCNFTTLYRIINDETPDPHSLTARSLERSLDRLETLLAEGRLPFDRDIPRGQIEQTLLRLFSDIT